MDNQLLDEEDDILYFETEEYLNDILKSYKFDKRNIINQLKQDIPRATIYWNNKFIKNIDQFLKLSKSFNYNIKIKSKTYNMQIILAMLIAQSSYYFPYRTVLNTFNANEKLIIKCLSTNRYVSYVIKDNDNSIRISADFAVKNIATNEVQKKITTMIVINLDNKKFNKYGMFFY